MSGCNLTKDLKKIKKLAIQLRETVSNSSFLQSDYQESSLDSPEEQYLRQKIMEICQKQYPKMVRQLIENPFSEEIHLHAQLSSSEIYQLRKEKPIEDILDALVPKLEDWTGINMAIRYVPERCFDPCQTIIDHCLYITLRF